MLLFVLAELISAIVCKTRNGRGRVAQSRWKVQQKHQAQSNFYHISVYYNLFLLKSVHKPILALEISFTCTHVWIVAFLKRANERQLLAQAMLLPVQPPLTVAVQLFNLRAVVIMGPDSASSLISISPGIRKDIYNVRWTDGRGDPADLAKAAQPLYRFYDSFSKENGNTILTGTKGTVLLRFFTAMQKIYLMALQIKWRAWTEAYTVSCQLLTSATHSFRSRWSIKSCELFLLRKINQESAFRTWNHFSALSSSFSNSPPVGCAVWVCRSYSYCSRTISSVALSPYPFELPPR